MSVTYSEPGVFFVTDAWYLNGSTWTGMVANDPSAAVLNRIILQYIIGIAQGNNDQSHPYGATIVFPGHGEVPAQGNNGEDITGAQYYIQAAGDGSAAITIESNWPLRFLGTGNAVLTYNIPSSDPSFIGGDMFSIQTNGTIGGTKLGDNTGGMTFEDLTLEYPAFDESGGVPLWAAIHTVPGSSGNGGAYNVRLVRCVIRECPIGVWFEEALSCSISHCTFLYDNNIGTAVMLGDGSKSGDNSTAKEIFISNCLFHAGNAPGGTAIMIQGSDQVKVSDCQIDSFLYGIIIAPGPYGANAVHHTFTNVTIYASTSEYDAEDKTNIGFIGSAVIIQPQAPNNNPLAVAQIVFTSCYFEAGDSATPTTATGSQPAVYLDASNGTIETIRFVSCYSARWPGPGLYVVGSSPDSGPFANDIEVLGGMYSGNNYTSDSFSASEPYGIYVGQGVHNMRIVGVSCIGEYEYVKTGGQSSSLQQDTGIYVDGGASDVIIDACDLTANATYGVYVNATNGTVDNVFIRNCDITGYASYTSAVSAIGAGHHTYSIQVTNCAGYNDQGAVLTPGVPFPGTYLINPGAGYFGPLEFYTKAHSGMGNSISSISVDGHVTPIVSGSFYLVPGEGATIIYTGTVDLLILGK